MIERPFGGRAQPAGRVRTVVRNPAVAAPLAVAGLMLLAAVARILMNRHVLAPWAMEDELQYSELAKSFAAGGHYLFRDQPRHIVTVYPALISPAWLAGSIKTTYAFAKAFNVVFMTLAAIPLWFWARKLVRPWYGVLVVALYLAIPSFVYTGEILTENVYLPVVVLALFVLALALERPTVVRQVLALVLAAAVVAVRIQGIVFAVIIPTAIVLKVAFDLRAEPSSRGTVLRDAARRWSLSLGALAFGAILYAGYKVVQGASLYSGFGVYSSIAKNDYSVREASRWVVYHFGELAFSVGVLPFSALVVLIGIALQRRGPAGPAERAFVAAATAGVFWTVVEAGVFASDFGFRIEERYMFNVVPVLLLALVVWLDRGLPRPPGLTAAAALLPAALLLTLPYTGFFTIALYNDTFGLIPLWRLTGRLGGNVAETEVLVGLGMLVAGLLFASVPRRPALVAIPIAVLSFFVVSTNSVFGTVEFLSSATRHAGGLNGDPSWIDHTIGKNARAEFLYTTEIDSDPHMLWQSEFWNRSVRRVFDVTSQDPSIPDVSAPLDPATGRIQPGVPPASPDLRPRYVVASSSVDVAARRLAHEGSLSLYRVMPPLRLASVTSGVQPDRWIGSTASYTRYVVPARATQVNVFVDRVGVAGPPPAKVTVAVGPLRVSGGAVTLARTWTSETWTLKSGGAHLFTLPVRHKPFQVQVAAAPTFSPSQYGSADTRQLSVRVAFSVR